MTAGPPMSPDRLTPAQARVLAALVVVHRRDGHASYRSVGREAGIGVSATHAAIRRLMPLGLVFQAAGKAGTLRPHPGLVVDRAGAVYQATTIA